MNYLYNKKKDLIVDLIYNKIIRNIDSIQSLGLISGKAGIVLFLNTYAEEKKSEKIQKEVEILINELWNALHKSHLSIYFSEGYSGIVWMLDWLREMDFLEINYEIEKNICLIDKSVANLRFQNPVQIDLTCDLFSKGLYFIKRFKKYLNHNINNIDTNLHKIFLQEQIIYMIDECERIIYKDTVFNNLFCPNLSLCLFNSILYFLMFCEDNHIYPFKTTKLIKAMLNNIKERLNSSDIADLICLKRLLEMLPQNINYNAKIKIDIIDIKLKKLKTTDINQFINILSRSGFYSLIYDNHRIFNSTITTFVEYNSIFFNDLYDNLNNDNILFPLSLNGISAIGYGLLNIDSNYYENK